MLRNYKIHNTSLLDVWNCFLVHCMIQYDTVCPEIYSLTLIPPGVHKTIYHTHSRGVLERATDEHTGALTAHIVHHDDGPS